MVVAEFGGVESRQVCGETTRWGTPRVHVLHGKNQWGVFLVELGDAFLEPARIVALPAEGRMDDDELGVKSSCSLGGLVQLAPGVAAPHIRGDEQAWRVNRPHLDVVFCRQLDDSVDISGNRVEADHEFHAVITNGLGAGEGIGRRLGIDRGRRQRHPRSTGSNHGRGFVRSGTVRHMLNLPCRGRRRVTSQRMRTLSTSPQSLV